MDKNLSQKDESTSSSLMELLRKYTSRVDERESLVKDCRQSEKTSNNEIEILNNPVNRFQPKITSLLDFDRVNDREEITIDYKTKYEESENKYYQLEKKYRQLETGTIKQLQDKIDHLQRDYNQIKLIKDRISEICSCRQLTNKQFEQLKYLVNDNNNLSIETIANKNDFHQQTIKLRSILLKHNDELLNKIDELVKKRKRNQYEEDDDDD